MSITVLETHGGSPSGLRFAERERPKPRYGELLIEVQYISPNWGESNRARRGIEPDGAVLGWDAAGIVVELGPDTDGPAVGSRVVTRGVRGGWATHRVATVGNTAVVPDSIGLDIASTLPTAGGTAVGALWRAGALLGKTVLVTGASGGVGKFAIQLGHLAGARVIASVGSEKSVEGLAELGADLVVTDLNDVHEPVDAVVESVGGEQLIKAFSLLRHDGVVQSLGWVSGDDAVAPPYHFVGPTRRRLEGFISSENNYGPLVEPLLSFIEQGRLSVDVNWRGDWKHYHESIETLLGRNLRGKAVWEVSA